MNHVESPNGVNIELSISSDYHTSNLGRRWYVQSDPNIAQALNEQYKPSLSSTSDSLALYTFLTRNDSLIELPQTTLEFKLTLAYQDDHWLELEDEPGIRDGYLAVLEGMAYRKVIKLKNNEEVSNYTPVGWARVVVSNSSSGISFMGSWLVDDEWNLGVPQTVYHLTTVEYLLATLNGNETNRLLDRGWRPDQPIVWREADIDNTLPLSSMQSFQINDFKYLDELDQGHTKTIFRRYSDTNGNAPNGVNLYTTMGDTSGCPQKRMISLMGIAVDCNFMKQFNSTQSIRLYLLDIVSQTSRFFEEGFNISLGLKKLVIPNSTECAAQDSQYPWNYQCVRNGSAINDRLNSFTDWRKVHSGDGIATWTLFTDCAQDNLVGIAWSGLVCENGGTSVVTHNLLGAHVLAHELGHSFGAVHDCDSDTCSKLDDVNFNCCPGSSSACLPSGQYLMNPSAGSSQQSFSACTQGNVCTNIARRTINSTCLLSNSGGADLISENICGNGIVEDGEECDCGGLEGCKGNLCCDPLTCKYTAGSQCDDKNEECCSGCKFATPNTVCRPSTGPCDFEQYCPGDSTSCPGPRLADNGKLCQLPNSNSTNLMCIAGHCTSRDLQCQLIMANRTVTADGHLLDLQKACDSSSCQLSCSDPNFGGNCFVLQQNFLDGTPCAGTGTCRSGQCIGGSSSFLYDATGNGWPWWKYIALGVGSFIGLSVVCWTLRYCTRRWTRIQRSQDHHRPQQYYPQVPLPPPHPTLASTYDIYPPPRPMHRYGGAPPPVYTSHEYEI